MYFPVVSEADLAQASYHQIHCSHHVIRQRMHYLMLRAEGFGPGQCTKILGIHPNTATHWAKCYLAEGLAAPQHCSSRPCHPAVYRTTRGVTQTRRFVKYALGMKCRRFRCLPGGKLSLEELAAQQLTFLRDTLQPLLEQSATEAIYWFIDEVNNGEHQAQLRTLRAPNFPQLRKSPADFSHKVAA